MALVESGVRLRVAGEQELSAALKSVDKLLANLDKATKKAGDGFDAMAVSSKKAERVAVLSEQLSIQQRELGLLQSKLASVSQEYGAESEAVRKVEIAMARMNERIAKSGQPLEKQRQQMEALRTKLTETIAKYGEGSKEVAKVEAAIAKLSIGMAKNEQIVAAHQRGLAALQEKLARVSSEFGAGSQEAKKIELQIAKLTQSIGHNQRALEGLTKVEEAAREKSEENLRAKAKAAEALGKAALAAGDLREKLNQEARAAAESATATQKIESGAIGASQGLLSLDRATEQTKQGLNAFDRATEQTKQGLNAFEQVAIGALRRVGEIAVDVFGRMAEGAAQFAQTTVKVAADYESTLNRFAAVAGTALQESGMSLETFDALALQMGKDTQFSAAQAADAMVNLAKGGIDPATIAAGGLKGVLDLAAAGELDLAEAAEIAAKQLGIWASEGVTGAEVANLLSQAANASTVDVDELALGLANAGGTAKVMGVEYNELVQSMALLAPGFSSASDAGTSFKVFLSRLVPTTNTAKQAMAELGLLTEEGSSIFFDAQGSFIGMAEASGILQEATKDLSEEQKVLYFNTIFGQDAIRAAAILSEAGTKGYNNMGVAMNKAGSAADQAAIRNRGLNFAIETLLGSFETFQIILGKAVNPVLEMFINKYLTPAVNVLAGLFEVITGGIPPLEKFSETVTGTFDAFKGMKHGGEAIDAIPEAINAAAAQAEFAFERIEAVVTSFAGKEIGVAFRKMAESAARAFGSIVPMFAGAGGGIISFVKGLSLDIISAMTSVFKGVNIFAGVLSGHDVDAFESVGLGDFGATIANVAWDIREFGKTVGAVFSLLTTDSVSEMSDSLQTLGNRFGSDLVRPISEFVKDVRKSFGSVKNIIGGAISFIVNKIPDLTAVWRPAFALLFSNWEAIKGAIMGVGAVLAGGVIYGAIVAIGSALAALASPIALVVAGAALLGAAWNTNFMGIQETTATVWAYVTQAFNTAVAYLSSVFGPVIAAFQMFGSGALQEIINFVTGTQTEFTNLSNIMQTIVTAVGMVLTDIVGAVILYYPQWIAAWLGMMVAAAKWILDAIPIALQNLVTLLEAMIGWLASSLPTWIANLLTWGTALVQWIGDALPLAITKLGEFLTTLITWSQSEVTPGLQAETDSWVSNLTKWISEVLIPQIKPELQKFQEEVIKALKKAGEAAWEQAKKIGKQIIDGIVNSIRDGFNRVQNEIAALFGGAETSAQEATESHSPSRVFMRIGQNMINGLLAGLQGGNPFSSINAAFQGLITTSQSVLAEWVATMTRYGQEAWQWVVRALPILKAQMSAWGNTLITSITTALPQWVMSLTPWSLESWQWLQRSIPPLMVQMAGFLMLLQTWANVSVLFSLKTSATQWSMALYNWIPNELIPGIQPMWEWFLTDSITNMKRIEAEMYKSGKNVGKAIIKGTLEAIKDGKGKIINLFIDVINEAIAAAKRQLGISSPSLVFYNIGQNIMMGLRDGIADGADMASDALSGVAAQMSGVMDVSIMPGGSLTPERELAQVAYKSGNYNQVAPPASAGQMAINRSVSNNYQNNNNYNLTVNTPRQSQGVVSDFQVIRAFAGA